MMLLALWPHAMLSTQVGEVAFFKNGFDEDTYALYPFGIGAVRLDRLLSGSIIHALTMAMAGSRNLAMIAIDVIAMPAAFLSAYFLSTRFFASNSARLLFALTLVFSSDLLTLGNTAVYAGPFPTLGQFRALFGAAGEFLVPPIDTSYLGLVRSPEPQIAYCVAFLFVAVLLRFAFEGTQSIDWRTAGLLALLTALLTTSYALVGYPLLAIHGFTVIVLAAMRSWGKAAFLGLLFVTVFAALLLATLKVVGGPTGAVFANRLPTITMSLIISVPVLAAIVASLVRRRLQNPRLWLAFAFAGMPIALTNQQLLSGVMVSTRDWERNITMPLLLIGAALWIGEVAIRVGRSREPWPSVRVGATAVLAIAIAVACVRSYGWFLPDNLTSIALARAMEAGNSYVGNDVIAVMDQPGLAPLVRLRMDPAPRILLDYTETFAAPIPHSTEAGFVATPHSQSLFEYWRETGVDPAVASKLLFDEARGRAGYYSGFLFNVCEYWYPCTDNRAVATEEVERQIPSIIVAYEDYLANPPERYKGARFVLLTTEAAGVSRSPRFLPMPTTVGRAGDVSAYLHTSHP